ncbi:hypothetical protein DUGA2_39380 [Duganella sp. HH101]|nr:hypothetical protein DUGA2_39380 [Duganella sp. HH101]
MLLSKKDYATWQDIQRDFPEFKASLGPWPCSEMAEYLSEEYPGISPSAQAQIAELRDSDSVFLEVRFVK